MPGDTPELREGTQTGQSPSVLIRQHDIGDSMFRVAQERSDRLFRLLLQASAAMGPRTGNGLPLMRPPAQYRKDLIPNPRVPRGSQKGLHNEREASMLLAVLLEGEGHV